MQIADESTKLRSLLCQRDLEATELARVVERALKVRSALPILSHASRCPRDLPSGRHPVLKVVPLVHAVASPRMLPRRTALAAVPLRSQRRAVDWRKHRCELGASCKVPAACMPHAGGILLAPLLQLSIGATTLLVNEAGECTLPVSELTSAIVSECNLNADVRVIHRTRTVGQKGARDPWAAHTQHATMTPLVN